MLLILVPNEPTFVTFCANILSEHRLEPLGYGGGSATGLGQVVAIRPGDALDNPDVQQRRSCRDSWLGVNIAKSGSGSARRMPAMLTPGFCRACSRALSPGSKKLMPLTVVPSTSRGLVRRPMARTPAEKSSSADR